MSSDAQLQEQKTRPVARQAKLFRGLADPSRLAILSHLLLGEHRVTRAREQSLSGPQDREHLRLARH